MMGVDGDPHEASVGADSGTYGEGAALGVHPLGGQGAVCRSDEEQGCVGVGRLEPSHLSFGRVLAHSSLDHAGSRLEEVRYLLLDHEVDPVLR